MQRLNVIKDIILRSNDLTRISSTIANEIVKHYPNVRGGGDQIIILVIREGAITFSRDVELKLPPRFHANSSTYYIKASSYEGTKSTGMVDLELTDYIKNKIAGKHVLIIDDIYDMGRTLYVVKGVVEQLSPLTVECCVKLEREIEHTYKMQPLFVGHKVTTTDFLVGGGLDLNGKLRDLPYIGTLKTKVSKWDEETGVKTPDEIYKTCLCNKCGESCAMAFEHEGPESFYGLINAQAKGFFNSPILSDCTAYRFDMCEKCLKELFDSFKLPVDELEYMPWTGEIYQ